ncbi:MAG TPA: group 1 truncated hemoglobin [Propionibacteriaceae bacterium]|nr:group 1 truncated hemoglobin [Propionibacteriaceae bacterium]
MSEQTTRGAVSDYEIIGGGSAVSAVVNDFYGRVLGDSQLAPYFEEVDLARLKRHQVLLVTKLLGGPDNYTGRPLDEATTASVSPMTTSPQSSAILRPP